MPTNIVSVSYPIIGSKAITRNGISIGINNNLPSRSTFYNCISSFTGSIGIKYYTIYVKDQYSTEPTVYPYLIDNPNSLIAVAQSLGCPYSILEECIWWINGGGYGTGQIKGAIVVDRNYWPVVTDGAVLFADTKYSLSAPSEYPYTGYMQLLDISGSGGIYNQALGIGYNGAGIYFNLGKVMIFDGINDYLQFPHSSALNISGSITVESWFFFSSISGKTDPCIVSKYANAGGGSNQAWLLFVATSDYRSYGPGNTGPNVGEIGWIATSSGNINGAMIGTGEQYPGGAWAHVVGVFNSSDNTMQLYVNGVLKRSVTRTGQTSGVLATNTRPVQVAATTADSSRWYGGYLSTLRIYNKALTNAQVNQNYYQGAIPTDQLALFLDASNFASLNNTNSNWYDLSPPTGVNNTGTSFNTIFATSGPGSIYFGGVNAYYTVASNTRTNLSSSYTLSVWFKNSSPTNQSIISKRDTSPGSNGGYDLTLFYSSGIWNLTWTVQTSSGIETLSQVITPLIGDWVNVCLTRNSSESFTNLYINGVLSQGQSSSPPLSNTKTLNIGRFGSYGASSDYGYYFSGNIGNVMIYQKSLTGPEIGSIHDIQRCNYPLYGY